MNTLKIVLSKCQETPSSITDLVNSLSLPKDIVRAAILVLQHDDHLVVVDSRKPPSGRGRPSNIFGPLPYTGRKVSIDNIS